MTPCQITFTIRDAAATEIPTMPHDSLINKAACVDKDRRFYADLRVIRGNIDAIGGIDDSALGEPLASDQ